MMGLGSAGGGGEVQTAKEQPVGIEPRSGLWRRSEELVTAGGESKEKMCKEQAVVGWARCGTLQEAKSNTGMARPSGRNRILE